MVRTNILFSDWNVNLFSSFSSLIMLYVVVVTILSALIRLLLHGRIYKAVQSSMVTQAKEIQMILDVLSFIGHQYLSTTLPPLRLFQLGKI